MVLSWWVACHGTDGPVDAVPDEGTGPLGTGWANPFPNADLMADGHVALRDLPAVNATPLPLERLAWRTGFSPSQVSVLRLDGVDPAAFPDGAGPVGQGSVRMVDLTEGRELRCMAELDAYPGAAAPATIVRPLEALPVGHQIAVVVTTDAVARPERFELLISGRPPASLADVAPRWVALVDDLEAWGIPASTIAVAWDFPVGEGRTPLQSALAQHALPHRHHWARIRNRDGGDTLAPGAWRVAEGTFATTDFLIDDRALDLAADGTVTPTGETDALLFVHVPESVKSAPARSVPILVFGHGIFGEPAKYLDDPEDPSNVLTLADRLGVIVVGTLWRGLAYQDRLVPIGVAQDFGRFHELTDLMVQGQVDTRTLADEVATGDLLDDPVFEGDAGQPLGDPDRIVYYGISLGGIEGMVFLAQDPPIDNAVFHVGGAMWSTLLERSSNWTAFELFLTSTIPDPADRQVLYALTQLWWDPVDPMSWTDALAERPFLLQESIGDEQVTNLGTEALARAARLPVLTPAAYVPDGLDEARADLPGQSRALVLFDPGVPLPPAGNRPAPVTHAHEIPRQWWGAEQQTETHLRAATAGEVVHFCGSAPCTADNPGDRP